MARIVKTVKNKENEDVEVYSDVCNICSREMIFPKKEADELESTFPFMKAKLEAGTSCFDCTKKKVESGEITEVFSEKELQEIKDFMINNMNKNK